VSIGWNPTYTGEQAVKQKMIEPYLLHEFDADFYGEPLRLLVTGYIRPVRAHASLSAARCSLTAQAPPRTHAAHRTQELKFEGESWLEDLKAAISNDVKVTEDVLSTPEYALRPEEDEFLRGGGAGEESEDPAAL
jgi:FAD synthase